MEICRACGLHYWHPMKIIKDVYEKELHADYISVHLGHLTSLAQNMLPFFERRTSGRLLDVGCGDGAFLEEAQNRGMEVFGIDFDLGSIKVATERRGLLNILNCSLDEFAENARQKELQFDHVTFFEVLEHQDDPQQFVEKARTLLARGGRIAGSVPNRERFWPEFSDWAFGYGDRPPHHFTRWSKDTLRKFLIRLGFTEIIVKDVCFFTLDEASCWWERIIIGNWLNKFRHRVKRRFSRNDREAHLRMEELQQLLPASRQRNVDLLRRANDIVKRLEIRLFLPFAIATLSTMNKSGRNLYFEASKA